MNFMNLQNITAQKTVFFFFYKYLVFFAGIWMTTKYKICHETTYSILTFCPFCKFKSF